MYLMTENKRFTYDPFQHTIDTVSGISYRGDRNVCNLLNDINDRADRNAEELSAYRKVMKKYGITTIEKLDRILFEQKVW